MHETISVKNPGELATKSAGYMGNAIINGLSAIQIIFGFASLYSLIANAIDIGLLFMFLLFIVTAIKYMFLNVKSMYKSTAIKN
jgi:hypothetical protein